MKTCLIIDTETTGLDRDKDRVIEIGAILYSIELQTSLASVSMLAVGGENPAEYINHIPVAALAQQEPCVEGAGLSMLTEMIAYADCFVAHNAEFDESFLKWDQLPWVCTKSDFSWPGHEHVDGKSLVAIALEHGIGVSTAHRALADCQLIAALFDRCADLPTMFTRAMRPKATFVAHVSYADRQLAKDAGFTWNPEPKTWTRTMAIEDAAALPFQTARA